MPIWIAQLTSPPAAIALAVPSVPSTDGGGIASGTEPNGLQQTTRRVALGDGAGDALAASGEVVFAKPGKMRWTYESPEPSLVVSDGATLWIYDPKAREVQKLPLGDAERLVDGILQIRVLVLSQEVVGLVADHEVGTAGNAELDSHNRRNGPGEVLGALIDAHAA